MGWTDRSWRCCFHDKENGGNAAAIVMGHTFPLPSLEEVPETASQPDWHCFFIKIAKVAKLARSAGLSITKGGVLLLWFVYFTCEQEVAAWQLTSIYKDEYAQLSWGLQFQYVLEHLIWRKLIPGLWFTLSFLVSRHFLWRCSCCSLPSWCSLAFGRGQEGTLKRNLPMRSHARSIVSWGVMYPSTKEWHQEKRVWLGIHADSLGCVKKNPKTKRSIRN